ncbi:unnamed protein product [Microthlaspi erraticum]|uniref:ADP-ribosyl cyclase/cyclic ADP-ribose hydrolase n=1 Tax=Microthlaspi erraticum TaxID=1685480 RepID=A0A6D2K5I7_9BRAS|nr:unnamed protein product [Microthlaspi erraticum]
MASSSSSSALSRTWRYRVFTSFHGPDVRKSFLSHLRKQFICNGISMFDDQGIERSHTIKPELTRAIKESRISIVVLSKYYASSGWCLDELLEIIKCKEDKGQIVMTIFYGVDPSDVRKQTGEFGIAFNKTCAGKTEEERRRWSQALTVVGNIAGEHLLNWDNEAEMIDKIAKDVLGLLNVTPSRDFDGMVGLEAHLREMMSLLDLDNEDEAMIVGIWGPAGIGKSIIARALHSRFSGSFHLSFFVDKLRGSFHRGLDDYGQQLRLQEEFLNQNGMRRIRHLGAVKENLCDQKVLIILDDVNNLKQLEALANETTRFGPGSRIVVTTENQELLQQHGIHNRYHVRFPSRKEAVEILHSYAFKQSSPLYGFNKFCERIAELCGKLPLALRVVGSTLRGKKQDEWEDVMNRLETILDREIEDVLRVGYEGLEENEQTLFLHIAVFFNYGNGDLVKAMFADGNLDVRRGLKILVNRSLIEMSTNGKTIEMHRLLKQMARQAIRKQDPRKRQILMDAQEICHGTSAVSGILFDTSGINEVSIGKKAFKRMSNLRFLRVYKGRYDGIDGMFIPEEIEFPRQLRLVHWDAYPSRSLPHTFHPENLVILCMQNSQLEYLWQGTQRLTNLKKMDLGRSVHLKEFPDLSNATNLERLDLSGCESLIEIPSSFSHLQKLKYLYMVNCRNIQVTPPDLNLPSLEIIELQRCSRLRIFLFISAKVRDVDLSETSFEEVPPSVSLCSGLGTLNISCGKLKGLTHLPTSLWCLDLSYSDIEKIPDCIKALHRLKGLSLTGCRRLASLPELPRSLNYLRGRDCESLETVFCPLNLTRIAELEFTNCFKLGQQARREIIQRSLYGYAILPGSQVPANFNHRGRGNSLTIIIPVGNNPSRLKLCVVVSPNHQTWKYRRYPQKLLCRRKPDIDDKVYERSLYFFGSRTEHLIIFDSFLPFIDPSEVSREIVLEFSIIPQENIIECGAYIWTDEPIEESYPSEVDQVFEGNHDITSIGSYEFEHSKASEDDTESGDRTNGVTIYESKEEEKLQGEEHTGCWTWLFLCFDLSGFVRDIRSLVSGRRR